MNYGLGYDSLNNDYKVVCICYYNDYGAIAGCADNVVSVYALRTNSWKRIENSPYDHSQHDPNSWKRIENSPYDHSQNDPKSGVLVGGALHWIARNGAEDVIVALNLTDERFRTMPSPGSLTGQLTVIGRCLFVFAIGYHHPFTHTDVWVMKEYGLSDSWTKFTFTYDIYWWRPLSLLRTGQVLFVKSSK